ncbi:uncharacterized protein BCR38DRAFT_465655 [Pseudomassariella vexata]|uniref:FAD-binding FR-type domain-containing protein n=1 Tax=Pseudomassariella vexata TaxID=1141098 RepID=A0A1Y2E0N8_9PEZI|nr:uncharacterized protein BCR38DRAFT_465655 [Pseudomassariella vexata]ORY65108.1 hypothetical protein BCR38DRAFT_465655 [Pseudomassariella vexata]
MAYPIQRTQPHNQHHDTKEDEARHPFLRSIIGNGDDKRCIPRAEFAERVKAWKIPFLKQDFEEEENAKNYIKSLSVWRRMRAYWAVYEPEILFMGIVMVKTCAGALYPTMFFLVLTLLFATLHAIGRLTGSFYWDSQPINQEPVAAVLGLTGLIALGLFYLSSLLSVPQVRQWNYEVFQLGHLLMYPIIGLRLAHGTAQFLQRPLLGYFLAFPTLLVLVERVVRVAMGFHRIPAALRVLDIEAVEIKATVPSERVLKYEAGQYVFLQVPKLSLFQWHPLPCPHRNWTSKLRFLGINGPFGAPAQRFNDFSHAIVVGTGIGVTPFPGILADLQARDNRAHGGPGTVGFGCASELDMPVKTEIGQVAVGTVETPGFQSEPQSQSNTTSASSPTPERTFAPGYRSVDFHWMVRDRNPLLCIRLHTYVTQKRKGIATHVYCWLLETHRTHAHPASPLTGLLNPMRFGRSDFVRILDVYYGEMKKFRASRQGVSDKNSEAPGDHDSLEVGVFFCGMPLIGEILADRCRLLTDRGRAEGTCV